MTKHTYTMTTELPTDSPVKGVGPAKVKAVTDKYGQVIAAIKAGETSSWALADALLAEVAPGMEQARKADYVDLVDRLSSVGVTTPRWNRLRRIRQVAKVFPVDRRFSGVSFGAHEMAQDGLDLEQASGVIQGLLDANGGNPAAVTVTAVRDAAALAKGKTPPSQVKANRPAKGAAAASSSVDDGSTGATNGTAIERALSQCRALTSEILGEATNADLETLRKVASNLIGRIDKVTNARATEEARATAKPKKVTTKGASKATKAKAKADTPTGMRG